mmetsp:Transcript_22292/g.88482  ORF Transcript_22292/g.88482 Transcript_22292/m.88482 type:complete len:507 (+) Transcript_22292:2-1522(+)
MAPADLLRRGRRRRRSVTACLALATTTTALQLNTARSPTDIPALNAWLKPQVPGIGTKVEVAASSTAGWGLVALRSLRRGEVALEVPSSLCVTGASARTRGPFSDLLAEAEKRAGYSWEPLCGDVSLIAAQVVVLADADDDVWRRCCWSFSDDDDDEDAGLPFLAEDAAVLENSYSSRSFDALRANADDDFAWLAAHGALSCDLATFRRGVAVALSRSFPVAGELVLAPGLDFANHDDYAEDDALETCVSKRAAVGGFGSKEKPYKIVLTAPEEVNKGEELRVSYGPLPAAAYAETYGFCPSRGVAKRASAACELRFDLDPSDRFIDDKRDILETNAEADGLLGDVVFDDGIQVCVGNRADSEAFFDYMRFARLKALNGTDSFLLEPLFSKEIWGFLALPISEENERAALDALADECRATQAALLKGAKSPPSGGSDAVVALLERVRDVELAALDATLEWIDAEIANLPLKEYYQERRLKDLGLDTEWCAEDAQWSGSRVPGGVDW